MKKESRKERIKKFVEEFNEALGISNDLHGRKDEIEKFKKSFNEQLEKAYETFYNSVKKLILK